MRIIIMIIGGGVVGICGRQRPSWMLFGFGCIGNVMSHLQIQRRIGKE
jgi:hypothetical protein